MLHIHEISSLELPELQPYRTLRRQAEHRAQRIFVAEGENKDLMAPFFEVTFIERYICSNTTDVGLVHIYQHADAHGDLVSSR